MFYKNADYKDKLQDQPEVCATDIHIKGNSLNCTFCNALKTKWNRPCIIA